MNSCEPVANGEKNIACISVFPGGAVARQTYDIAQLKDCRVVVEKSNVTWVNVTLTDVKATAPEIAVGFGFPRELVDKILEAGKSEYLDQDSELGMLLPAVRVTGWEVKLFPLLVFVRKNLILTIHPCEVKRFVRFSRYAEGMMKKFKESQTVTDRLTIMLIRILDENNEKNFDGLRAIEEEGERFSQYLVDTQGRADELGEKMHNIKQALVDYLGALWASLDVLHSLRYGDADVITDNPKILDKMSILVEDVNRNLALGEHVSEVLASGLGVLQTIYNNQLQIYNNQLQLLNNKLALLAGWLAVAATAVAVPNTLATIFGIGKVADLLPWEVIIFVIVASTVIATYFVFAYVRSKGLMPKSPDKEALTKDELNKK
ncbi:MAG: CorA family divalent cation transporter [Methanobacteriota archaeon]